GNPYRPNDGELTPTRPTSSKEVPAPFRPTSNRLPDSLLTKLEDFIPLPLYFDNDNPDPNTANKISDRTYDECYQNFSNRRLIFETEHARKHPENPLASQEMTDFFAKDVTSGYRHLLQFADVLLSRLKAGDKIEIGLQGFASPRSKTEYNQNLGHRRTATMLNFFKTAKNNAFESYLSSGQLVLIEKSFGESTASNRVSDSLFDDGESVYSIEASLERRLEILEINSQPNTSKLVIPEQETKNQK
ncbi:MAG: hypothetical protein RLZZ292_1026, partial [Bacteroidota bacterium]